MTVSVVALGEGFHNYHHTFPYDYSTSEWGHRINLTTAFIDFMALIGQKEILSIIYRVSFEYFCTVDRHGCIILLVKKYNVYYFYPVQIRLKTCFSM